jgi:hypothetical protein
LSALDKKSLSESDITAMPCCHRTLHCLRRPAQAEPLTVCCFA